jgi:hypothetical protein
MRIDKIISICVALSKVAKASKEGDKHLYIQTLPMHVCLCEWRISKSMSKVSYQDEWLIGRVVKSLVVHYLLWVHHQGCKKLDSIDNGMEFCLWLLELKQIWMAHLEKCKQLLEYQIHPLVWDTHTQLVINLSQVVYGTP